MNTLSWMIYAAELAGRYGFIGLVGGLICALIGAVLFFISKNSWHRYRHQEDNDWAEVMAYRASLGVIARRMLIAGPVLVAVSLLLPSPTTIYMIAASEAGQQIVTSPDGIEMMTDLKAIIKKRLRDELGAK
jgi:ABC-type branched-subunit amino acid transport system permease subunit